MRTLTQIHLFGSLRKTAGDFYDPPTVYENVLLKPMKTKSMLMTVWMLAENLLNPMLSSLIMWKGCMV